MAELSTLPPSPPALSEHLPPEHLPSGPAHLSKVEHPADPVPPIPKSSLYGNKALASNPANRSDSAPNAAETPPENSSRSLPGAAQTLLDNTTHSLPGGAQMPPDNTTHSLPGAAQTLLDNTTHSLHGGAQMPPDNETISLRGATQDFTDNTTPSSVPVPGNDLPSGKDPQPPGTHSSEETVSAENQNALNSPSPEIVPSLYPSVQVTQSLENTDLRPEPPQITPLSDSKQPLQQEEPPSLQQGTQEVKTAELTREETPDEKKEQCEPQANAPMPPKGTEGTEGSPGPSVPSINEPAGADCSTVPPVSQPAPDTLSYLESASLMSGTLESLSGLGEDGSSVGSDSEVNGLAVRRTDKYGFLGGNQYSESGEKEVRVEVSRQREMKWLDMFNHWDKWVKHRFQKVKMRCRKGIPSSLRARAWQLLSNSSELLQANPGKFEELEREQGEAKWLDIIEKDLHRQFPFHEMFAARGGHGQQDLYRILKAYTVYRPDEGYCQAQAPVAAVLLMHMPAEQAFWCLVQICEKYLPGYYSAGLEAIQLDGEIFFSLLRRTCPMAYRHLKKFKIDPILYMTEWFMCIFSRTLPWASVLRVWDMFFCEGVKIVFRVGLVLLKQMLGSVDKLREVQGMYETMERLRNITPDLIREDVLVQEIVTLPVTEALIERECGVQVRKWRESRGELSHQPGRRLHGTHHIYELKRRASSLASGGSFSFLGSSVPPPGPLRASSSLLSLPGFRRSKAPFHPQPKKSSFSGPSRADSPPQSPPAAGQGTGLKPPLPPQKTPLVQSPLASNEAPKLPAQSTVQHMLSPSPKIVSEQITPKIPSPTANNAPLPPCDKKPEPAANNQPMTTTATEEEGKRAGKKTKEDKKREKEDERKRQKDKREKEKAEKERLKKEKERQEKEKKRSSKKKQQQQQHGAGGTEEAKDKA